MGAIRSAREQLDALGSALEILQTVVGVISDKKAIQAARDEFVSSMQLCEQEVKNHEAALLVMEQAETKKLEYFERERQIEKQFAEAAQQIEEKRIAAGAESAQILIELEKKKNILRELQEETAKKSEELNLQNIKLIQDRKDLEEKLEEFAEREENINIREYAQGEAVETLQKKIDEVETKGRALAIREEAVASRETAALAHEEKLRAF